MSIELPLARLQPSKLNPRKHFEPSSLDELTASIKNDGVLENLIVRPVWCVGIVTIEALGRVRNGMPAVETETAMGKHEIVSGHRRYLAAVRALGDAGVVPVVVRHLTDPEALRINLTEQLQRNQLTPLEEAEGFATMLGFRDEKGTALHTVESLAASVGMKHDFVLRRLKLRPLPANMKKALNAGAISPSVAELVARIPQKELREEAGAQVLTGGRDGQPMTQVEVQSLLTEKFMVQLKGAPFDQENEHLVSAAGKCSVCPHRTGNNKAVFGDVKRGDICTNPSCYRQKCGAAFSLLAIEAKAAGARVLDVTESAKIFETHRPTEVRFNCDWVELDTRPLPHLLKADVNHPPLWRELSEKAKGAGMATDVVLAKDGDGRGRMLVNSVLLITAAEKLGEPIFKGQKGDESELPAPKPGEDANDTFRRGQREHAEKKKADAQREAAEKAQQRLVRIAAVKAVHAALVKDWKVAGIWEMMLDMVLSNTDSAPWTIIIELLGLKPTTFAADVRKALKKLPAAERQAIVPQLLLSRAILDRGTLCSGLRELAVFAGVKLSEVEKAALSAVKPPRKTSKAKDQKPKKVGKKGGGK